MTDKIESLAKEFEPRYPGVSYVLKRVASIAKEQVKLPRELSEITAELKKEWSSQASTMADLYAKELGQSKQEYVESLPEFFPQPDGYQGRFDIPIISETRLPLARIMDILGVKHPFDPQNPNIDISSPRDWENDVFKTSNVPYATWVGTGKDFLESPPGKVRAFHDPLVRQGTLYDGVGMLVRFPDILRNNGLYLLGTQDNSPYRAFYMQQNPVSGKPEVVLHHVGGGLESPEGPGGHGFLIAGRAIKTKT